MRRRLEKCGADPARDAERMAAVHRVSDAYQRVLGGLSPAARHSEPVTAIRWAIEEFRVSLFAQPLGARGPVSEQRIQRALDALEPGPASAGTAAREPGGNRRRDH
jgi:ATP-dependent helicase HrpA